jgi:transposase
MLSFPPSPSVRIFVARESVDMRKGIDGLAGLVIDTIDQDPQSGHVFVFFNKHRNCVKSLVWDGSGYWLLVKRLEHGRFAIFDRVGASRTSFEMSNTDLALLLDGVDLRGARRRASHDELNARVSR